MVNDIYHTLELWAKLARSNCQTNDVVNHNLPDEDSKSERGIEVVVGKVSMPGNVVKEA